MCYNFYILTILIVLKYNFYISQICQVIRKTKTSEEGFGWNKKKILFSYQKIILKKNSQQKLF